MQILVGRMRYPENDDIGLGYQLFQGNQSVVLDERVGTQNVLGLDFQRLLELVRQRFPYIVDVTLESHPENAHHLVVQITLLLQPLDDEIGHTLIYQHGGMSEEEVVVAVGGQLHGVFEQTRAGRKTGTRQSFGSGVVCHDGLIDPVKVEAAEGGNLIELVRYRKLAISPGI